jgi:hypothetical protein
MDNAKIIVLQNGNKIICLLNEVMDENNKGICFSVQEPYVLGHQINENAKNTNDLLITFERWIPYSSQTEFKIPYNQIVTIGEVQSSLLNGYIERLEPIQISKSSDNTTNTIEQNNND